MLDFRSRYEEAAPAMNRGSLGHRALAGLGIRFCRRRGATQIHLTPPQRPRSFRRSGPSTRRISWMIKNHSYPYITVLAEENHEAIQAFLRRVELLAGSMALITAPNCAGNNTHEPNDNSGLETLLRNYWVLSDTLSVRFPWIESSLTRSVDGPCGQVGPIHNISTLWHLSSGHLALDSHFEIMVFAVAASRNSDRPTSHSNPQ